MVEMNPGANPSGDQPLHLIVRHSRCSACKREAMLASYELRGPVRLGNIPILPRPPRRVIDACPLCQHASGMSVKLWEKQCREGRVELGHILEANEIDFKKLKERIQVLARLADRDGIAGFAASLRDCRIQTHESVLFVARTCDGFQLHELAEDLYRLALEESPTDVMVKEKLAACILRQGRTDDVEELLRHAVERLEEDKVHLLYEFARVLYRNGNLEQALWVLDVSESVAPDMVRKREYQDLRAAMEANGPLPEVQALPSPQGPPSAATPLPRPKANLRVIALISIGPILLLLVLGVYMVAAMMMANNRRVIFVNGLSGSYQISVNGGALTSLRPGEPMAVHVREGVVRVSIQSPEYDLGEMTFLVRSDFWSRPIFYDQFFVINPDGVAILRRSDVVYINRDRTINRPVPEPKHDIHLGGNTYHFRKVHYPFVASPDEVDLHAAANYLKRSELFLADPMDLWYYLPHEREDVDFRTRQGIGDHLRHRLQHEPHTLEDARNLLRYLDSGTLDRLFNPFLLRRPVEIGVHRLWQDHRYRVGDDSLEREYEDMLAREPENAALKYLVARITRDFQRAAVLYQEAGEATEPCLDAWYDLARWNLAAGRAQVAHQLASRALRSPNPPTGLNTLIAEAAIATGNWMEAEEALRRGLHGSEYALTNIRRLAYVLARTGRGDDIMNEARRFYSANSTMVPESSWEFIERMEGILEEVENPGRIWDGHMDDFEYGHVAALIFHDRLGDAIETADYEGATAMDLALLYLATRGTPRAQRGEQFLEELAEFLDKQGGRDYRLAAAILRGDEGVQPVEMLMLSLDLEHKMAVLLATSALHPELAERCGRILGALNFKRMFPHPVVEKFKPRS